MLAIVLTVRGVPAWRAWVRRTRESADMLSARAAIVRRDVAGHRGIAHAADSLAEAYFALAPALIRGATPSQAAAALAAHVSDVAAAAGTRLGAVQLAVDSGTVRSGIYTVRVRADVAGDVRGITTLLHALEGGGAPLLAVRSLTVSQGEPGAPANRAEALQASFEVEGIGRADGEP